MYASLILSRSPMGVRQTAIIPTANHGVRVLNRLGFARGLGGTWAEQAPSSAEQQEVIIDKPIAIPMTPAHMRDADFMGRTPNNVLQALGKRVNMASLKPTSDTLDSVFSTMLTQAQTDPLQLAQYVSAYISSGTSEVVEVEQVVEPVVQIQREPEPEPVQPTVSVSEVREQSVLTVPPVEDYYERSFEGVSESDIYDKARANQWNVLLIGDAGTGKTSSARNYAARNNLPFVSLECNQQIDLSVTQGRFVPDTDGKSLKWVYSVLATAVQQPSVVLLNELTRMIPKSASLFLRLLAERELVIDTFNEVIKVHPECVIVADANVGSGYSGTMRADNALLDRFHIKLPFTYDDKLERKFMPYPALLNFATSIRKASDLGQQDFTVPMSTRLLLNFVSHVKTFNFDFAVQRLLANFPSESGEREAIKLRLDSDLHAIQSELV